MKTLTAITTANYSYGTGQYMVSDYVADGYVVSTDTTRFMFRYVNELVEFQRGPQYPAFSYQFIQPEERTAAQVPSIGAPAVIQVPFQIKMPDVTDTELAILRTFINSTVPHGESFSFIDVGGGKSFPVILEKIGMKVRSIKLGHSEVILRLVRV